MSNLESIIISSILTERQGRYKPNDPKIVNLNRLDKIDFYGNIHLSNKPTKTDMIIVEPGDLVISGINASKGAIAVYNGDQPITATIHYSSYIFDKNKIDIEYFKRYLKSPVFIRELNNQVKGGIKTEIKPKDLLPIIIKIHDMPSQLITNSHFNLLEDELRTIDAEIKEQSNYLSLLRQAILQEAIDGRLTSSWRKKNPFVKGDPNHDAKALLEKIGHEKQQLIVQGKIKKEKPLTQIKKEEIPFALPEGWAWTKLGIIILEPPRNGYSPKEVNYPTKVKSLKLGATTWGIFDPGAYKFIDEDIPENSVFWLMPDDILIQRSNSIEYVGVSAIYNGKPKEFIYPDLMMKIQMLNPISVQYSHLFLSSPFTRSYYRSRAKGSQKSMPKINQEVVLNTYFALPPLAEQRAIVSKVDLLCGIVDKLDRQVAEREIQAEEIVKAVWREAFGG